MMGSAEKSPENEPIEERFESLKDIERRTGTLNDTGNRSPVWTWIASRDFPKKPARRLGTGEDKSMGINDGCGPVSMQVISTPYGRPALDHLRDTVANLKANDPLASVTIVVPNNTAGIVARRHLAAGVVPGTTGIAGIEITTLTRLAERIAAHTLSPRRPATKTVSAAIWRQVLVESPGVFSVVAEHPATVRALSSADRELRDVSDAALETLAGTSTLACDVIRLHGIVNSRLSEEWYDETDILRRAAELVSKNGHGSPVVLYLPQALTKAEATFARALGETGDFVIIAGLTRAQRADEAVRRSLTRLGAEAGHGPERVATAHQVINASDSDDEVRCVVREVVKTLKTTPAHRIAILYGAPSPYARLLHEQLAAAGITVNGRGVRAVNERTVARTLLETLALIDRDLPRADLFRALANAPVRDFEGALIPISRWERISREAGVVGGSDWEERLTRHADHRLKKADREEENAERPWLVDRLRAEAQNAMDLSRFAVTLRASLDAADALTSWQHLGSWCLDLFTTFFGDRSELMKLPPNEQYAATTISSILAGIPILDSIDTSASLRALRDLLELELAAALPRVGKFGNGVFVGPISSAIGLELDTVFLVGLSEDIYPGRLREDPLLPESARTSVTDELTNYRESLHAKYRELLAAMACAERVVATFPRGDLRRSTQRLPSRWLLGSLRELSGDHSLAATEWQEADYGAALVTSGSFAGELLSTNTLATEQEWRTRQAVAGFLTDDVASAAGAMIDARSSDDFTRYDGNLAKVDGLPNYAVDDIRISPTALESYASCPHAFFVNRLLGVQPLEHPEDIITIAPMDIGNLIHECFEDLITDLGDDLPGQGEPWKPAHRVLLMQIAERKASEFQTRGLTGHSTLWEGEKRRVIIDLMAMLDKDDVWRLTTAAGVTASELPFGLKDAEPVEIVIPSGRVLMRGSADKVDVGADGTIFVTDIKTGSRHAFKDITQANPVVGGTKLQLPVYAYAARQAFGERGTPVVTAYWFVRKDPGRVEIALTQEVEVQYTETVEILVGSIASGLFPAKAPAAADFAFTQCPYCNPDGVGHAEPRERWERKRHDPDLRTLVGLIDADAIELEEIQ